MKIPIVYWLVLDRHRPRWSSCAAATATGSSRSVVTRRPPVRSGSRSSSPRWRSSWASASPPGCSGCTTALRVQQRAVRAGRRQLEFIYIIAAVIGGCLLTGGYGSVVGADGRGPDLRHDPARHLLRRLGPRLVQDLPRDHAHLLGHAGEPVRQAEGGGLDERPGGEAAWSPRAAGTPVLELVDCGKQLRQRPRPARGQPHRAPGRGDLRARRQRCRQVDPHQDHLGPARLHRGHDEG